MLSLERDESAGVDLPDGTGLAALSIPLPGLGPCGVRAGGGIPGSSERFGALRLDYPAAPAGEPPRRWIGTLRGDSADLVYEATATTEAARPFPGGAFLGFDFEARLRPKHGEPERRFSGSGFSEQGGQTLA